MYINPTTNFHFVLRHYLSIHLFNKQVWKCFSMTCDSQGIIHIKMTKGWALGLRTLSFKYVVWVHLYSGESAPTDEKRYTCPSETVPESRDTQATNH